MKKVLLLLIVFLIGSRLFGSLDCIDNSRHLATRYDYKEYHAVQCNCQCEKQYKISPDRGKCIKCHHYRVPRPFIIISENDVQSVMQSK